MRRLYLLLLLLSGTVLPVYAEDAPDAIEACIRANLPESTSRQSIELKSRDRTGYEQVLQADIFWKRFEDGRSRVQMYFHEPVDVRGARFLIIENQPHNDMYIYMPGLFKVRRINSERISSSILGTDFSYEDFERLHGVINDLHAEKQQDALIGDRPVHVLVSKPAEGSGYERVVSYVDKESCLVLRTELFEHGEHLRKIMTIRTADIYREGGHWIPRKLLMRDVRDKTETELVLQDISMGTPIRDEMFDPDALKGMGESAETQDE